VQYVGKRVDLVYDTDTIDIFHGFTHVATHHRNDTPYEYTTKPSHNLPGRKGSCESDIEKLLSRAAQIDNIVLHYLRAVIEDRRYPELAFRVCRGIMKLEKKYGQERLVSGCAAAMDARLYSVSDMVDILESGADADYLPGADTDGNERLTPDSFLNWLLSREWDYRAARNIERLVKNANFRYGDASMAQIDHTLPRGLDRNQMERLAALDFVRKGDNLFITGCAGTGGTLKIAKNEGTIDAELKKLEKAQLLILDDLFLVPLDAKERAHLTEIIEDRHGRKSIIVTSQLPELDWYDAIGDPTVADAILDRIVHTAHRITLTGESVRKLKALKSR
jgi:DNA replication protein DnaC